MIQNIQIGDKCKDCILVQFGTGDIMMSHLEMQYEGGQFSLGFAEMPGRKIGDITKEFEGLNTDQFPTQHKVVFSFSKPESITALVHSLLEVQKRMFDKNLS